MSYFLIEVIEIILKIMNKFPKYIYQKLHIIKRYKIKKLEVSFKEAIWDPYYI